MSDYPLSKIQIKLVLHKNADDDDDDENGDDHFIDFVFKLKNIFTSTISIYEPTMYDKNYWNKLYNGEKIDMIFCDSNGVVSIKCNGTNIKFTVNKSGAGGDGMIVFSISHGECKEAIKKYIDFLETRPNLSQRK